jgi:hypothetical protein
MRTEVMSTKCANCRCTEVEDSEHLLLLRSRAVHADVVVFGKTAKLCRSFRVRNWFALIVEQLSSTSIKNLALLLDGIPAQPRNHA